MRISKFSYSGEGISVHHTLSEQPMAEQYNIHTHETVEIYFFLSGTCKYLIEGNEYELAPGDLIVMRPSESHTLCVLDNTPYERIVVNIDPRIFEKIDNSVTYLKRVQIGGLILDEDLPLGEVKELSEGDLELLWI